MAQRRAAPPAPEDASPAPTAGLQQGGHDHQHGLVVAAHGRHVVVETPGGTRVLCHPRGKKSELVVGDHVLWQPTGDGGVIETLLPRRNLLFRQDDWRSKSFAANLDLLLVLVAGEPTFGESQLARALIAAAQADITTVIGLNKTDLPSAASARERLLPYRAMGVPVLELALKTDQAGARALLRPLLAGRTTLVLGASGMGKSTLINLLVPAAAAQVGEISQALGAGRHTTTTTTWYWLDDLGDLGDPGDMGSPGGPRDQVHDSGSTVTDPASARAPTDGAGAAGIDPVGAPAQRAALIDSPGFQEFGLRQIEPMQLAALMPDFAAARGQCRFHNCSHLHEPDCGVRAAMARGEISPSRQRIYAELFEELSRKRW